MPDIGLELLWIAIAAIVYLLFDTYPVVRCFRATFQTGSFYLLWLILSVLNVIAYGILKIGAGDKITGVVGANLAPLTLVFLATIGTLGILQSLTLKVADYKFIDVGLLIDKFRTIVLADISKVSATREQRRAVHLAGKLAAARGVDDLRNAYMALMTAQGRTAAQVTAELAQLTTDHTAAGTSLTQALALRIALVDIRQARELLSR